MRNLLTAAGALAALLLASTPAPAQTGGVNTGLPGSTCAPTPGGFTYSPPGEGVTPDGLGPPAPAAHEVGEPLTGSPPRGIMLVIHGGGWYTVGRELLPAMRPTADRWRRRGWTTVNLTYGGCARSLDDVTAFYDLVRERWPDLPVCALGGSAGGQLALMLGVRRPGLRCAASQAGPTGLENLLAQNATKAYWQAAAAFGVAGLAVVSPLVQIPQLGRTRTLLSHAASDPLVPLRQSQDMDAAAPLTHYSDLVTLDPGGEPFAHASIAVESRDSLHRRELNLVAPITGEPPAECDLCGAGAGWARTQTGPAAVTMSNDVARGTARLGVLKATLALTDLGGSWSIPAATLQLPAGRHRLQTCWGASGTGVTAFDACIEREVTLAAAGPATTLAKTAGLKRLTAPYTYYAALYVKTYSAGTWAGGGGSWRGAHASRIAIPPLGAGV